MINLNKLIISGTFILLIIFLFHTHIKEGFVQENDGMQEILSNELYYDPRLNIQRLFRGFYALQLQSWLKHFRLGDELIVFQYEKLKSNPSGIIKQIFDFLGLPSHSIHPQDMFRDYSRLNNGPHNFPHSVLSSFAGIC